MVGVPKPIRRSGARLKNTTSLPPVINSNQATTNIDRRVQGDKKSSLSSLESRTESRREEILRIINDGIGMNSPGTIVGTSPQIIGQGRFKLFNPIMCRTLSSTQSTTTLIPQLWRKYKVIP